MASSSRRTPSRISPIRIRDPTAAVPCQRDQVAIAKTVADLRGLAEHAVRTGGIAGEYALQCDGKEQIALLDAILVCVVEQLARPRDPAARARTLALVHQTEREPERASRGARHGATLQEDLVRTRPDLGALRCPCQSGTRPSRAVRDRLAGAAHRRPLPPRACTRPSTRGVETRLGPG